MTANIAAGVCVCLNLAAFALLLSLSEVCKSAAISASEYCARILLPSVFPFAVVSRFMMSCPLPAVPKKTSLVFSRLFDIREKELYAFALGLFCGFPIGTICAYSLADKGEISLGRAARLSCIASNAGASFMLAGTSSIFGQSFTGRIIFFCQTAASLIVAAISADRKNHDAPERSCAEYPAAGERSLSAGFSGALSAASLSMLNIFGTTVFFSVILAPALSFFPGGASLLLSVFLEISAGLREISSLSLSFEHLTAIAASAAGWSGLSVMIQSCAASGTRLPILKIMKYRFACALISGGLSLLISVALC